MNHIGDIFNQDKSGDVSEVSCSPGWKEYQIILTQRTNLDEIRVFVVGNVGLVIGSNELLGLFNLHNIECFRISNSNINLRNITCRDELTFAGTTLSRKAMKRAALPLSGK
jgi:hypothetical protein